MTMQVLVFDRSVLDGWVTDTQTVVRMSKVLSEIEIKQVKTSNEVASDWRMN